MNYKLRMINSAKFDAVEELKDLNYSPNEPKTFIEHLKTDFFNDRIFMQVKAVESPFMENYEDISVLHTLFRKYDLNPYIYLTDDSVGNMLMNIEIE